MRGRSNTEIILPSNKKMRYKPVIGQIYIAAVFHVLPFVQYQHGQRTDDIEACDTQNEGEGRDKR